MTGLEHHFSDLYSVFRISENCRMLGGLRATPRLLSGSAHLLSPPFGLLALLLLAVSSCFRCIHTGEAGESNSVSAQAFRGGSCRGVCKKGCHRRAGSASSVDVLGGMAAGRASWTLLPYQRRPSCYCYCRHWGLREWAGTKNPPYPNFLRRLIRPTRMEFLYGPVP